MQNLINILIKTIFVENVIFAFFLGMCSFLAVSKKIKTAFGLGLAVVFVMLLTTPLNYLILRYMLQEGALSWIHPSLASVDLTFLSFILFISTIAGAVQLVEMVVEKFMPGLYNSLGIFLPLITVNCSILGASRRHCLPMCFSRASGPPARRRGCASSRCSPRASFRSPISPIFSASRSRIKNDGHLYHPRTRFSLAHELGHFLIDEHYNLLRDESIRPQPSFQNYNMENRMEVEADYFASCLLMPESRIRKDLERRKFTFALIDEISKKYNVSSTAALLRFIAINTYPIMVVCSRDSKIAWYRKSDDFPFFQFRLGQSGGVNEYTSAGEYFYEGKKNLYKTETVYAEDWFVLSRTEDRRRPFKEYCLYYEPMKQVISVLWE